MLSCEAYSSVNTDYQETYASASRTDDNIRISLAVLLDDFSLSDLPVNCFEDFERAN